MVSATVFVFDKFAFARGRLCSRHSAVQRQGERLPENATVIVESPVAHTVSTRREIQSGRLDRPRRSAVTPRFSNHLWHELPIQKELFDEMTSSEDLNDRMHRWECRFCIF